MSDETIVCHNCKEPCTKDYIRAMGHCWHLDHFVCAGCKESLKGKAFYEHEDTAYCKDCFEKQVAPKCACCQEGIVGDVTTALGKSWKPEHFVCTQCKKLFEQGEGFLEKDGMPYCKSDYYDLFKPKCNKCLKPITDKTITAMDKKWHAECFVCVKCSGEFKDGRFFVINDQPYCAIHRFADKDGEASDYLEPVGQD